MDSMSTEKLTRLGPVPQRLPGPEVSYWRKLPLPLIVVVGVPTLLAVIYYLLIASPRYVSEARFVVRQPSQTSPSGLGFALQGVGLSSTQTDAFAVHEYVTSRDAVEDLKKRVDLKAMLRAAQADPLSRYPRPWEGGSEEDVYKAFQRFVVVGYNSSTGISTLRVEAFRPQDAQSISKVLLEGGERLVNQLNTRSAANAVSEAELSRDQASAKVDDVQRRLTQFRNQEGFIDPARAATESGQLIGGLLETVASLRAERAQLASQAPQSPQLPTIDARIAAFERQIELERGKITGSSGSLAPKIGTYEELVTERELADRELVQAAAAVVSAQQEARRQQLYLDRVVNPNLPDKATEPRRLFGILTIFLSTLLAYAVGWLIIAGVREHKQD